VRWLSTVNRFEGEKMVLEKMALNAEGFPEPTGEFEELDADALVLALGQDTDLSLLDRAPGIRITNGVVTVEQSMMAAPSASSRR